MYSRRLSFRAGQGRDPLASPIAAAGRGDGTTRVKSKQLNIRLSEKDHQRIQRRAEKAKVNLSAYVLAMALQGEIVMVDGLPDVAREIRYIGNNLNQLTKLCHEGRIQCADLEETKIPEQPIAEPAPLPELLRQTRDTQQKMAVALGKILMNSEEQPDWLRPHGVMMEQVTAQQTAIIQQLKTLDQRIHTELATFEKLRYLLIGMGTTVGIGVITMIIWAVMT